MEKLNAVVDLLSESWRLNQFAKKLSHYADEKLKKKILNQVSRFDKHFQTATAEFGLEVLDFTGTEFEDGLPITPDELYAGLNGEIELPPKPVLITFDDGYIDNYTNAFPILKKYNLRATIFIIPAFTSVYPNYMTWEQLKEMEANGITIESHTLTHPKLEELPDDEIRNELLNSKNMLEEQLGHPIEFLAYPTGTYNLHIAGIAQDLGYKGAFTIKYGVVDKGSNFFALERVPIFHTATTMKDFYERIAWRQSFEEFGWTKR